MWRVSGTRRTLARGLHPGYCRATATAHVSPTLHLALPRRSGLLRLGLMTAGVASGVTAIVLVAVDEGFGVDALLGLFVGWSFIASGIAGWARRPENDVGALMVLVGLVWFVSALLKSWHESIPFTLGLWLGDVWVVPLAFLLAGFPTLRLEGRVERVAIAGLLLVMGPLEVLWLMCLNFATEVSP